MKKKKIARYLRNTARTILIIFASFFFIFALLSGAETFGGGLKGILLNSPNAFPWALLFVLVYVAWKWELVGGSLITLMGLLTLFAFNAFEELFALFAISLPLIILGLMLITSWRLTKTRK